MFKTQALAKLVYDAGPIIHIDEIFLHKPKGFQVSASNLKPLSNCSRIRLLITDQDAAPIFLKFPKNNGGIMQKQTIQYHSSLDALVAVAKRLSTYEERFSMSSEDFYDKYSKGDLDDSIDFVEWSNDYQHYLTIRRDLENHLKNAA